MSGNTFNYGAKVVYLRSNHHFKNVFYIIIHSIQMNPSYIIHDLIVLTCTVHLETR
jgi:hypothetical protein